MSYPNELSFTHPHVQRLRRLVGRRSSRLEEQSFVVEGVKTLTEALDANAGVLAVFADADFVHPVVARCESAGLVVHRLAPGVIERVADTVSPQPIMGVVEMPKTTLADLRTPLRAGGFVLVCVEIRDPGNAGTVIRSAEASGAVGVVFTDDSVEVTNPKTVRASAGALFHVPVLSGVSVVELAGALESWGVRSFATEARSATKLMRRARAAIRDQADSLHDVPRCATVGRQVLHRELSRLLADLQQAPTADTTRLYTPDDLPTLAGCAIPDAAWTVLALGAERTPVRCISREALVAMAGDLAALRDAVAERLSAAQ